VQILAERGPGAWGFLHLTFQEFFAAAGLHACERFEEVALGRLFDPRWEEVIRLGVSYLALVQRRPVAARRFVERVLAWREPAPNEWMTAVLRLQIPMASLLAAEAGDALPGPLQERIAEELADWVVDPPTWDAPLRYLAELGPTDFFALVAGAVVHRVELGKLPPQGEPPWAISFVLEVVARHAPHAVERLLRSDDIEVRRMAIARLIQEARDFKPYLRWALDGQPEGVCCEAISALLERSERVEARDLLLATTRDERAAVRSTAVVVLGSIREMDRDTAIRLDELARCDADLDVRTSAAEVLVSKLGRDEDIALAFDLLSAQDPRYRSMDPLPEALAERGHTAWLERQWLSALGSGDERTRADAVSSLALSRSREARQAILDATEDPSPLVRAASIQALRPDEPVDPDIREQMERRIPAALTDPVPEVRRAATGAVAAGWLEGAALQGALATARQDADPAVRLEALRASDARGPHENGEDLLLRALEDPDPRVVVQAAWMLAARRVEKAVPRLLELAGRFPEVRGALWRLAMNGGDGDSMAADVSA
jgi:HEAT repeat protein